MGKITFIILFGLGIFLATSVLKDKDLEFAKNVVPKCGDPKIQIRLPKYKVEGKQADLNGKIRTNAPPGINIKSSDKVLHRLVVADLFIQETLVNTEKNQIFPRSTYWNQIKFPDGRSFYVYYPAGDGSVQTNISLVSEYINPGKPNPELFFADWGLVFLIKRDDQGNRIQKEEGGNRYWLADVYQDITYPFIPPSTGLLECTIKPDFNGKAKADPTMQIYSFGATRTVKKWNVI